jgi:hypothetical protein
LIYKEIFGGQDIVVDLSAEKYDNNGCDDCFEVEANNPAGITYGIMSEDNQDFKHICAGERIVPDERSAPFLRVNNEALPYLYSELKLVLKHHTASLSIHLPHGLELPPAKFKNLNLCKTIEWPLNGMCGAPFGSQWIVRLELAYGESPSSESLELDDADPKQHWLGL